MMRSVASKALWVGRATSAVVGLAIVLALVVGLASAAFGANGGNFILGSLNNTATALTRLTGNVSGGPALQVVNNNTAAGSRGLQVNVAASKPPILVNATAGKATNLNADKLDGKDSSELGVAGFEELEERFTLPANTDSLQFDLPCPTGKQALGGGFGSEAFNANIKVKTALPSGGTGNGWTVVASNSGSTESFIDVKVICAVVQ